MKSSKKDLDDILELLRNQGWKIQRNGNNHWKGTHPDGRQITVPARTGNLTGYMNTLSQLRREGVHIPRKNPKKKHLR